MAASAAALRILLRRRAGALAPASPSLELLQPLFSGGPYSKQQTRSPLHAAAAAGLPDSRRAQLDPAAVPSLLRRYSGKGCRPTPPWKPTNGPVMWGLKQVATAAANIPDKHHIQLSPPPMLSLIHHYSNKGGGLPRPQQPIDRQVMQNLKQVKQHCSIVTYLETWLHTRRLLNAQKDLLKRAEMLNEALKTFEKASNLLAYWLDDRAVAMFGNELDNTWKAFTAYEKAVDDFAKAVGSSNWLPVHILEQYQTLCKRMMDSNKSSRQILEKSSSKFENLKMRTKLNKAELFSPFEILKMLTITAVRLGTCLVLTVVIVRACLT